jgi:predicted Zn-dependent protease with MMP-like domain
MTGRDAMSSALSRADVYRPRPAKGRRGAMSDIEEFTQERFETVAQETWDGLPAQFREIVGNLAIQVVDFADRHTLATMDIDSPWDLLGLYHGVGLPFKSVHDVAHGPDMIFLYRQPILRYARQEGEDVDEVIRHVLIHEIGHHFGFSDDDMEDIEANTP